MKLSPKNNSDFVTPFLPPFKIQAIAAVIAVQSLGFPVAHGQESADDDIESIFVLSKRRAYQGNFSDLENPTAVQLIDGELLREVGALNLNDALDLSASVARQNNFGGLWNSFSIRGFFRRY